MWYLPSASHCFIKAMFATSWLNLAEDWLVVLAVGPMRRVINAHIEFKVVVRLDRLDAGSLCLIRGQQELLGTEVVDVIACVPKQLGYGYDVRWQLYLQLAAARPVVMCTDGSLVNAGYECRTTRQTDRCRDDRVGELDALSSQSVDVGCLDRSLVLASKIG